jgi:tetratricopeptide (TPR) repeat protein
MSFPFPVTEGAIRMKKSLVTLVLAFAVGAAAQTTDQQQTPPAGGQEQSAPSGQQSGQVTIKNPAEYNAYVTALQQNDPAAKAQALEAFLQQYPQSVMKVPALELLMAAYQQTGNQQKTVDAAQRLLQADPNSLRALAVLTFINRTCALQGGPNAVQCLNDAGKYGQQGLQVMQTAQPPAGTSPADFDKLKTQVKPIFEQAVGLAALQNKNYAEAQQALSSAVQANPNDFTTVYQLALSYLSQKPINPVGLWWIARAVNLAQGSPAQAQIANYGKRAYTAYHGGDDGWDQLLASAQSASAPPPDLKIAPAPTPAEQAAKLCQTKQVKDMSFDEFQMIFTSGNQQCADQVWSQIKDKPIAFEGKVISTGTDTLQLAATYDDIQNNVADVELKFPEKIPTSLMPKAGEMAKVQGTPTSYDATPVAQSNGQAGAGATQGQQQQSTTGTAAGTPTFMIHMDHGAFIGKKPAAATPAKKAPARKGATHRKK